MKKEPSKKALAMYAILKKIVTYQAHNKKFSHFTLNRKCTLNMTIRQISSRYGYSKSTVHRYIKQLEKAGYLKKIDTKENKTNPHYRDMIFYMLPEVYKVLLAKFKVKAYKCVKKMSEKLARENNGKGTLRKYLLHKYYNFKKGIKQQFKLGISKTGDIPNFVLLTPLGEFDALVLDARFSGGIRPTTRASKENISIALQDMIKALS